MISGKKTENGIICFLRGKKEFEKKKSSKYQLKKNNALEVIVEGRFSLKSEKDKSVWPKRKKKEE